MRRLVLALLIFSAEASAQMLTDRGPPLHRLVHRNTIAARVNPLGLGYDGRFSYRYRLFATDSIAFRDNFLSIGIALAATPTYGRIGAVVEVQPATFIGFWAGYDWMQYFGNLSHLQSFPLASSNFSERQIKAQAALPDADPLHPYAVGGVVFSAGANVNLRFGPIVVRNAFKAFRPDFPLRAGDTAFYEQLADLLLPNRRFTLLNDLDVLYTLPFGLYAGLRYSAGAPLYGPENGVGDNATHRLGPFFVWRLFDHDGAAFNQPTIALLVNWYLKHPYRTGGLDSPTAVPYFAIAFQTNGDLISLPPVPPPQNPTN